MKIVKASVKILTPFNVDHNGMDILKSIDLRILSGKERE